MVSDKTYLFLKMYVPWLIDWLPLFSKKKKWEQDCNKVLILKRFLSSVNTRKFIKKLLYYLILNIKNYTLKCLLFVLHRLINVKYFIAQQS